MTATTLRRTSFALLAAVLPLAWFVTSSTTNTAGAAQLDPTLELVRSDMWLSPNDPIRITVDTVATPSATVTARLYGVLPDRAAFLAALSGDLGEVRENFEPEPIRANRPTPINRDPSASLPEGVYPVEITLTAGDRDLDEITVFIVSTEPDTMLHADLALLAEPEIPIAHQPDGSVDLDVPSTLDRAAEHADILTLRLTGETIAAATETGVSLDRLGDFEIPSATFVDIEPSAWLDADAESQLRVQLEGGRDAIAAAIDAEPAPIWLAESTANTESLEWLSDEGLGGFVLRPNQLQPLFGDPGTPMTAPFTLSSSGRDLVAMSVDEVLGQHLDETDTVLASQRLLADVAVMMHSSGATRHGFIAEPSTIDAIDDLRSQVEASPFVDFARIEKMLDDVPLMATDSGAGDRPLVRALDGDDPTPIDTLPIEILFANAAIQTFDQMLVDSKAPIAALRTNVLVGSAASLSSIERDEYFEQVYDDIDAATSGIEAPEDETITLTARTQTVPYTIRNGLGYRANVLLVFESDTLDFPDGATVEQQLELGDNHLDLRVHSRSSGDAVLQFTVRSPDATRLLTSSRVRVRSTVFSGLGIVITVAALAVLLLWWAREIVRSRRAHRASSIK